MKIYIPERDFSTPFSETDRPGLKQTKTQSVGISMTGFLGTGWKLFSKYLFEDHEDKKTKET